MSDRTVGHVGDSSEDRVVTQVGAPESGTMLAGRYRLDELSADPAAPARVLWLGTDVVLSRPVTVEIRVPGGPSAAEFLAEAIAASRIVHPCVLGVYDAVDAADHAYVVRQRVRGDLFSDIVRDHTLPPVRAAAFVRAAAEGLAAIHEAGNVHGNLHPGTVYLDADGSVTLKGFRLGAMLEPVDDLRALGGLLYAALTGRWPADLGATDAALPDGARDDGRLCSPRQMLAGIPAYLDNLTMELLAGTARSAAEIASELRRAEVADQHPLEQDDSEEEPLRRSRWLVIGAPVLAVVLIVLAGWLVGTRGLQVRDAAGYPSTHTPEDTPPSASPVVQLDNLVPVHARILDPGGDGTELANASRAIDRRLDSSWSTAVYRGAAHFGNIRGKTGMGVLVDLGVSRMVREVTVTVNAPGTALEVRTGSQDSDDPGDYRTVASTSGASSSIRLTVPDVQGRYWLLWITALPEVAANRYSVSVREIGFAGPPSAG
jgi:hypothetical protein